LKKVLVISYYWPPAGGIGVLRCLKFVKYLREFGWEPIVFAPENADYPYYDDGNFKDIPEGVKIIKRPIWEPFKLFKLITRRKDVPLNNIIHVRDRKSIFDNLGIWVRGNFFIPDARSFWIKPSVKYLIQYLKENPVDAILTDGPPHTNTVIGTQVSRALNIPHLADFQDPWTQVDYYELFKIGKNADAKHKRLEQETFKTAKKITIASPSWKKDIEKIGAKNVDVVYYGYDEDDFRDIKVKADDKFTICHAGLLGYDRNPNNLFEVLKNLSENEHGFKDDLKIKLLGQIDIKVQESMIKSGLESNLLNLGTVNRKVALQEISNSWILLLPLNKADNVNGRIPGKFFEYIRAKRPIISFGPHSTDVNNIMQEYNLGINIDYSETEMLTHFILEQYKNFKKERFNATQSSKDMSVFSNFNQTKLIGKYLDEITQ
jgi:glycosyltransferase involved in cell wall biosynthesis